MAIASNLQVSILRFFNGVVHAALEGHCYMMNCCMLHVACVVADQFDDDVEGTGMGEGEGKKDVTDQIEDEEQLLGLKGDQEEKEQSTEPKELGTCVSCMRFTATSS